MIIVADENIPFIDACLGDGFEVRFMPGRAIDATSLQDANGLLVRSVTRVDADLLAGSPVDFVGSATAGVDHVDVGGLERAGVRFAHAPGCNSESVAQYVTAALFHLREDLGGLAGKSIGIVGVGHCGSKVERIARGLGMDVLLCDPPLARTTGEPDRYVPLDALIGCDIVTLHVPLTHDGRDATLDLIGVDFLSRVKPGSYLINAARGGIVDEKELLGAIRSGKLAGAVLDTWVGEPSPSLELIDVAAIATPHIAGYSIDGKLRGTQSVCDALARHFSVDINPLSAASLLGEQKLIEFAGVGDPEGAMAKLVAEAYPIVADDSEFRHAMSSSGSASGGADRASEFDRLRKKYGPRREFSATRLTVNPRDKQFTEMAEAVGFEVQSPD